MAPSTKRRRFSDEGVQLVSSPAPPAAPFDPDRPDLDGSSDGPKSKRQKQPRRQLFVRSLPATATSESLAAHFSESYPLKHATVVVDPVTKTSRGYAFVTFADPEDAQRARDEFDGTKFEGKKIGVELSEPRHRDLETTEDGEGHNKRKSRPTVEATQAKARRQKQQSEAKQPPKLIVRNLPWSIKEPEQLAVLFRSFGKVKHSTIPKKKPGLMAGFGFIVMRGRKNAEKALEAVNGKEVDGRILAVDWAVEKEVWESKEKDGAGEAGEADDGTVAAKDRSQSDDSDGGDREDDDLGATDSDDVPQESEEESEEDYDDHGDDAEMDDMENETFEGEVGLDSQEPGRTQDNSATLFVRNLPFSTTDDTLKHHFAAFGPVRYARVVMDHATDRPRGTGFVCFFNESDADACLRDAPRPMQRPSTALGDASRQRANMLVKHSVLENELADPTGGFTVDGRVLQITRAVNRHEAIKLTEEGHSNRDRRDRDKRRLYLLSEGTVAAGSPLYDALAPSEIKLREGSAKQRKSLVQSNPSLHLSLTRLSIRNLPRHVTSKDLKALAREAAVGFAKDVKARKREQLSREEESRGGDEMRESERLRKLKGKGIVKQAKIVFEGREGSKVSEGSGAGRSRGYGFVEYSSHRWALMGLRWLNGHAVGPRADEGKHERHSEDSTDRKKRLIVEFAIENAQVVARRKEREEKARERSKAVTEKRAAGELPAGGKKPLSKDTLMAKTRKGTKRKRDDKGDDRRGGAGGSGHSTSETTMGDQTDRRSTDLNKLAKRQQIIAKKRMQRRGKGKRLAESG